MSYIVSSRTWGNSNAKIKEWATFFRDSMLASGWALADVPGQLDPATITAAAPSTDTNLGYFIFVLDDSLKATSPIYLRAYLVFSSVGGTGADPSLKGPQIYLAVGWALDSAGQLTGNVVSGGICAQSGYTLTYKPSLEVFAGGDGWATVFHGLGFASSNQGYFYARQIAAICIERGRKEDGTLDPDSVYITMPQANRPNRMDPNSQLQYFLGAMPGSSNDYYVSMATYYLPKAGVVPGSWWSAGAIIGFAALNGSVDGVLQAQPFWKAYPRISPLIGVVSIPALMVIGQEFTASFDGVNDYKYVCLGAAAGWSSQGAMYALDSQVLSSYCPAARIQ